MVVDWLLILAGLALLLGGGEALVRGASGVALFARLTPAVVGLTVVAAGTSMPELVVSAQAAIEGSPGLAVGNIVGSNLFNIGLILGLTALVRPLRIQGNTVRLEWPVMLAAAVVFAWFCRDASVDRVEGGILLAGLVLFVGYAVWISRQSATQLAQGGFEEVATASFGLTGPAALALNAAAVIVGVGLLGAGSTALVRGAVSIASSMGISETIIGLTIVAAGTSTPELMTSIVAAWRGRDEIAVANVVGSNIFNILGIAGATAIIHPLPVPAEIIARDTWWMLGASLLLLPLVKTGMRINRWEGAVLIAGFSAYLFTVLGGP